MTGPKILLLDIETAPNLADVWSLWPKYVGLNQLREVSYTMCAAWKWKGAKKVHFAKADDLLPAIWSALDDADLVGTWNGDRFDLPTLNKDFLLAGMPKPSPYKSVDLCKVAKKNFRFQSNKLEHVSTQLGLDGKVKHEGHTLWVKCMAGDPKAWKEFERYNKQDVWLLDYVWDKLEAWLPLPNLALYGEEPDGAYCPRCLTTDVQKRGLYHGVSRSYQRYRCGSGHWFRAAKSSGSVGFV